MASLVSRMYAAFRGVDFRGEEVDFTRSPDSLNVWRNYKELSSIQTRPRLKQVLQDKDKILGMWWYKDNLLVQTKISESETTLFKVKNGVKEVIQANLSGVPLCAFVYGEMFYFLNGRGYYQYDGTDVKDVLDVNNKIVKIPTTTIGRKAGGGGGTVYEDVNMLVNRRKNSFVGEAESSKNYFHLDSWASEIISVTVNGNRVECSSEYDEDKLHYQLFTGSSIVLSASQIKGIVFFGNASLLAPTTDGQDNIIIEFIPYMTEEEQTAIKKKILNCSIARVFDNRVFFTGNPEHPNTLWHSSLYNPAYISDLDYYVDGIDSTKIKDMVAGSNALWVFREPTDNKDSVFYHVPTIDGDYGKIYPSSHSGISLGCTGKAINFNDDVVFFSPRGMEGVNGDVTTEQFAAHRSTLIDRKLLVNADYKDMILVEWEGYLIVFMGNEAFLADSRAVFTNENHIEYEWYHWNFNDKIVTSAIVNDGVLYVGTEDGGIYEFTNKVCSSIDEYKDHNIEGEIESYWTTPKDKFSAPHKLKTTNKKGCVVEATGDIEVFVKTDNEDEFLSVGTYQDVTDYFTSQIKKKKFKDIQLRFYSRNNFTLESATLEAIVGGYIKD